jgi:alkylation response protein AidB-like acyl-CoA dehydrogenase
LLLDLTTPGVEVRPIRQLTGEPEFNEIFLTDVKVPVGLTLGERGAGWSVAVTTLSHERGTHGAALAAQLWADYRAAVSVLSRPDASGCRPLDSADVRDQLTEIWIEISAVQIANLRAIHEQSITGAPGPGSTIAKLCWSEVSQKLARLVVQELGPDGVRVGPDAPDSGAWAFRLLRTRGNSIEAGTSEVLRNIIAERVLGLPRSR